MSSSTLFEPGRRQRDADRGTYLLSWPVTPGVRKAVRENGEHAFPDCCPGRGNADRLIQIHRPVGRNGGGGTHGAGQDDRRIFPPSSGPAVPSAAERPDTPSSRQSAIRAAIHFFMVHPLLSGICGRCGVFYHSPFSVATFFSCRSWPSLPSTISEIIGNSSVLLAFSAQIAYTLVRLTSMVFLAIKEVVLCK